MGTLIYDRIMNEVENSRIWKTNREECIAKTTAGYRSFMGHFLADVLGNEISPDDMIKCLDLPKRITLKDGRLIRMWKTWNDGEYVVMNYTIFANEIVIKTKHEESITVPDYDSIIKENTT